VRAALDWLDQNLRLPILFAGFSFGSYIGLNACCGDARVKAAVALGLPTQAEGRDYNYNFLRACAMPKLFISGTRDQFGPQDQVADIVAAAQPPAQMVWVEGADHFFTGKLEEVQSAIRNWLQARFPSKTE
jgi:alpha/beta superfamily hydrolase